MKRKATIIAAILIIVLALVGKKLLEGRKQSPQRTQIKKLPKTVKVDTVRYGDVHTIIMGYGRLNASDKIEIFSEVSGILLRSNPAFKEGNYFKKGQALLKIDDSETRLNLYSRKSDFLSILTQILPDIKSDFHESYDKWNNYLQEYEIEKSIGSLPAISGSKEKYFLAARNVFALYYAIKNLELRLSKHIIKAPFEGSITQNLIETGSLVRAGQKLGGFASVNNFEMEVAVSADETQFIEIGNKVKISFDLTPSLWEGHIIRISKHIDHNSQTVKVFINITGEGLKEEIYLKAEIEGNIIELVFELHRKSIIDKNHI